MSSGSARTVLFVDNSYTFGGAINALAHLVGELDRDRVRPIVLSAQPAALLEQHFPDIVTRHWSVRPPWVDDRINQRVLRWPGFRRGPLRLLWSKARTLWRLAFREAPEAFRLAGLARKHDVDLVHLNNGVEGMVSALVAAKLLRLPVIAHARGPHGTAGAIRAYVRMADHWIAVSRSIADNLVEAGVDPERITVVHDAIDLSQFEERRPAVEVRAGLGISPDAPVFGIFGRIIPWKGIREFVVGAKIVLEEVPGSYALVVGDRSDGSEDYYREVVDLSTQLGIGDRVLFTGFRTDIGDTMRACDVVVHTSILPEPFGMTIIEAMATGRPVVAANAGGPTEIVIRGETGLLADPTDPADLSGAIIRLLRNPRQAADMGRKGFSRARDHFSAVRYAREVESVYDGVM